MSHAEHHQRLQSRQYGDSTRLNARSRLHERYGSASGSWQGWVFDQLELPPEASVLEIGCGPGDLWRANRGRIPSTWSVTLTDLSPGMMREARRQTHGSGEAALSHAVADAGHLPFGPSRFEAVVANHMLYHVADVEATLAEAARVMRPGGRLYAATVGLGHMRELFDVAREASPAAGAAPAPRVSSFSLESGWRALERHFDEVRLEKYHNPLEVDSAESLMEYLLSTEAGRSTTEAERDACHRSFETVIQRDGAFRISTETGLYVASLATTTA